jgi:DNA-binding HxlR family transcriptional regulator
MGLLARTSQRSHKRKCGYNMTEVGPESHDICASISKQKYILPVTDAMWEYQPYNIKHSNISWMMMV